MDARASCDNASYLIAANICNNQRNLTGDDTDVMPVCDCSQSLTDTHR